MLIAVSADRKSDAAAGSGNAPSAAAALAKTKDADVDKPQRAQKAAASLAQQLDQLKLQGTEAFLRAISRGDAGDSAAAAAGLDATPATSASTSTGRASAAADEKMKIANKPPPLLPRRPTAPADDRPRGRPPAAAVTPASAPRSPLRARTVSDDAGAARGRSRLDSCDSVESGVGSADDSASVEGAAAPEDATSAAAAGDDDEASRALPTPIAQRAALRPPVDPAPSKTRAPSEAQRPRGGRKVRIAEERQPETDAPRDVDADAVAVEREAASPSHSAAKKKRAPPAAVKYGNHLRPAHAPFDEDGDAGAAHTPGGAHSKPTQFELMRREQQLLKRSIGAALQTFARSNRKQEALQAKAQQRVDRAARAAAKLFGGFCGFEASRGDGDSTATHLWEEKTQLRAGALAAKMRFLAAGGDAAPAGPSPSTAEGRAGTASTAGGDADGPAPGSRQRSPPDRRQPARALGDDFARPGGHVHSDMQRLRLAAQRDVEQQELRALLSPRHKWFGVCVAKVREHLRRSSNTAPPGALKFVFLLQLLLRLQAAATERQRRQRRLQPARPASPARRAAVDDTASPPKQRRGLLAASADDDDADGGGAAHSPHRRLRFGEAPAAAARIGDAVRGRSRSRSRSPQRPSPRANAPPAASTVDAATAASPEPAATSPSPPASRPASRVVSRGAAAPSPAEADADVTDAVTARGLPALTVTPRVLALVLLSPLLSKEDLRKALVQQLVEVVRDGIGWSAESFARFLEHHELPVPAELLNLLRSLAKERTAKRDRERRETSLSLSLPPGALSPGRPRQASVAQVSFSTSGVVATEDLVAASSVADCAASVVAAASVAAAAVARDDEATAAASSAAPALLADVPPGAPTLRREALLAESDET